ncbi:hypothetical protein POM88_036344 [Heracleum sosnowskyi]|uniref:Uncharacterized protein n=1 Tax=Heracleum sosnowskyi TaxID=360622 RepID=A0AAD8HMZ9_9APIA|nr:hypothetical protein POM88_036344 [Heracleum sosnowskyi]
MKELAKFMVTVCRGQSLSLETFTCEEVDAALAILDNLFQLNIISITRVMIACHALSYLSFERIVPIEQGTLKRLIGLTFHADYTIVGSALGVVGNIVRWGSNDQIQSTLDTYLALTAHGIVLVICFAFTRFKWKNLNLNRIPYVENTPFCAQVPSNDKLNMAEAKHAKVEIDGEITSLQSERKEQLLSETSAMKPQVIIRLFCEKLTQVVEVERDSARDLQPLPFHYVEITRLLFDHAHASSVLVLGIFIVAYKLDSPEMIQDAEIRPDDKY